MTSGGRLARGAAKPMGLVPNNPRWPPQGAMAWGPLPTLMAMKPARASGSIWWAMTPEWCELRITAAASGEAASPSRRVCCASSIAG